MRPIRHFEVNKSCPLHALQSFTPSQHALESARGLTRHPRERRNEAPNSCSSRSSGEGTSEKVTKLLSPTLHPKPPAKPTSRKAPSPKTQRAARELLDKAKVKRFFPQALLHLLDVYNRVNRVAARKRHLPKGYPHPHNRGQRPPSEDESYVCTSCIDTSPQDMS